MSEVIENRPFLNCRGILEKHKTDPHYVVSMYLNDLTFLI